MTTKFNVKTNITLSDFCEKAKTIQIIEKDPLIRKAILKDNSGNECTVEYSENNKILTLTNIAGSDPEYFLYLLVRLADAKFLSEENYKKFVQSAFINEPAQTMPEITIGTYEESTNYFMAYACYYRHFEKELQSLTKIPDLKPSTNYCGLGKSKK